MTIRPKTGSYVNIKYYDDESQLKKLICLVLDVEILTEGIFCSKQMQAKDSWTFVLTETGKILDVYYQQCELLFD